MTRLARFWPFRKRETWEERLTRIVAETRDSYEREQYRRRRAAALKGLGK
jgi:hypothetical protein